MEYKPLGRTNLMISVLGFGGCPIGGHGWGKVKDDDSIAAIRKAARLGINFFDTADVYGLGHSEKILAKALGNYRKKVIIATKVGVRWNYKEKRSYRDLSPKHIREAAEDSLKRLKIDCIPLYQIHYPDPQTPISETMEALGELQKEGKIRYIGCSNFSAELIDQTQKYGRLESLQTCYNLLGRDIEQFIIPTCRKWKMTIIAYGPLAQGFLTGKFNLKTKFGKDDRRSRKEYKHFHGRRFKANLIIVDKLKEMALKYKKTPVQVAIRWILDNDSIASAILGIQKPEEIEEDIGALGWKLAPKDRKELIKTAIKTYQKYKVNLKDNYYARNREI